LASANRLALNPPKGVSLPSSGTSCCATFKAKAISSDSSFFLARASSSFFSFICFSCSAFALSCSAFRSAISSCNFPDSTNSPIEGVCCGVLPEREDDLDLYASEIVSPLYPVSVSTTMVSSCLSEGCAFFQSS